MTLDKTLKVLNEMVDTGVIARYSIGGAVAAFLYIEPGTTFDLDIFIAWEDGGNGLLDMSPIYNYLMKRGYHFKLDALDIEGWAVQFLPAGSGLVKEALDHAQEFEIGAVKTRVFTQEHLMAISLETGRPKDMARLVQFIEEDCFDCAKLDAMLTRWGLQDKWEAFNRRFYPQS